MAVCDTGLGHIGVVEERGAQGRVEGFVGADFLVGRGAVDEAGRYVGYVGVPGSSFFSKVGPDLNACVCVVISKAHHLCWL